MISFINAGDIVISNNYYNRLKTNIPSIDTLFSDGILPGSVTTIAAKHGTGKTQFCLHTLSKLQDNGYKVGYISNEESVEQLAFTCKRINTLNVPVANADSLKDIIQLMQGLDVVVVDSFSKLRVDGEARIRSIEKRVLDAVIAEAKKTNCAVFFIMHLTKMGKVKGSSLIEHDVDATLFIKRNQEDETEADNGERKIYFEKNRFGAPNEIVVRMTATGYDFEPIQNSDTTASEQVKTVKAPGLHECIENLTHPVFTMSLAAETLDLPFNKVQVAIYQMTREGKLYKQGAGKSAEYSTKPFTSEK